MRFMLLGKLDSGHHLLSFILSVGSISYSPTLVRTLIMVGTTCANLLLVTASWGLSPSGSELPSQSSPPEAVDANLNSQIYVEASSPDESAIEIRPSTRAADLLPKECDSIVASDTSPSPESAADSAQIADESAIEIRPSTRAADLLPKECDSIVASDTSPSPESAADSAQTATEQEGEGDAPVLREGGGGKLNVPIFGSQDEDKAFSAGFGSVLGEPTALQGPTRDRIVLPGSTRLGIYSIAAHLRQRLSANQSLLLELIADPNLLGFDFSYTIAPASLPGAVSVNISNQRSRFPGFERGEREVELPNGEPPWVHRLGGGIEYFQPLSPELGAALGLNYQRVSVRDAAFTSNIDPVDELGNQLTFSNQGQDDLLTLNLAALYSTVNDLNYPTRGLKARFGIDQSIPVGAASTLFTRLSADFTQFIPFNLFGFSEGPRTLVLNLQGGTMIGDVPPYEAFNLGGSSSVRGYEKGEVGSGRSFIQATAEYRFPMFSFSAFKRQTDVGGTVFVDYATDLGTGDEVTGEPAEVRGKPGNGLGYGVGLRAGTPFGLFRLEFGLNDQGGSEVYFIIGDRF